MQTLRNLTYFGTGEHDETFDNQDQMLEANNITDDADSLRGDDALTIMKDAGLDIWSETGDDPPTDFPASDAELAGDATPILDHSTPDEAATVDPIGGATLEIASEGDSDESHCELPARLDYATSRSRKNATRRLHRVGWCWRIPGVDYKVHESFRGMPDADRYDDMCKHCWEHQGSQMQAGTSEQGELEGSTSSSSAEDFQNMMDILGAEAEGTDAEDCEHDAA